MSCKYIYIRDVAPVVFDENGDRQKSRGFPVGCVAYRISEVEGAILGDSPGAQQVEWAYSIYNPNDSFDKRHARAWAKSRLDANPRKTFGSDSAHPNDLLAMALKDIARCEVHQWANHLEATEIAGGVQIVRNMHKLTERFRQACLLTASNLRNAKREAA